MKYPVCEYKVLALIKVIQNWLEFGIKEAVLKIGNLEFNVWNNVNEGFECSWEIMSDYSTLLMSVVCNMMLKWNLNVKMQHVQNLSIEVY